MVLGLDDEFDQVDAFDVPGASVDPGLGLGFLRCVVRLVGGLEHHHPYAFFAAGKAEPLATNESGLVFEHRNDVLADVLVDLLASAGAILIVTITAFMLCPPYPIS